MTIPPVDRMPVVGIHRVEQRPQIVQLRPLSTYQYGQALRTQEGAEVSTADGSEVGFELSLRGVPVASIMKPVASGAISGTAPAAESRLPPTLNLVRASEDRSVELRISRPCNPLRYLLEDAGAARNAQDAWPSDRLGRVIDD